jgi:antitoxin component YwqK of YwqJK toxin-antitoxin module
MVGEAKGVTRSRSPVRVAAALFAGIVSGVASDALAQSYAVTGSCRDGEPNGAYELRMPDGRLRIAGAFAKGKRTGTYLFWAASGARIAVVPYDDDVKNGTVALWYAPASANADAPRKLEAAYVTGRLHGSKRSWHTNGNPRTELRYERGELVEARAWVEAGAPLSEVEARAIAVDDLTTDERIFATLEAFVADNRPDCE